MPPSTVIPSFSDSGASVMQRSVDASAGAGAVPSGCGFTLDEYYDVPATVEWLLAQGSKKVALQFPDALLPDAPRVSRALEIAAIKSARASGADMATAAAVAAPFQCFILGDTSYGSCCVDEVE